ncbi:hypothetical protein EJ08DRAFT_434115 [Tothia fuscella]|uniref:Zn(2)-C6 fungal-type domain-containing protein n=1 Tax=Tothia fuscella TaxID=1048955 RepID=A0A9P4U2H6_9PEZI|nr:hypothetical protein EJ08DRAFT_434115 [Tothia fuscella]
MYSMRSIRCSGERPSCERCRLAGSACTYSTGKPLGKPKGSKNKVQRNKTSPDLESRQTVPESQPSTSTPPKSPLKRPNEDALPSPKRTASETSILRGRSHQTGAQFFSPKMDIPEMPSLQVVPRHEDSALVCGLPYYTESAHHESTLQQTLEHPTPGGVEDVFASASLNLEMDDFQWFSTTPTGIGIDLSIPHESISGISSSHQSGPPSILAIDQQNSTLDSSLSPSVFGGRSRGQPCLCDPLSLGIISELHTLQLSYSPLDAALILARRGLTTVSSYLSCSSCLNHLGGSQSLFLACVLILQQVFACYITLKVQGNKLLSNPEGSGSSSSA